MNANALPQVGLFGKIPAEGDFVSRRLPWEFMSAWDAWLQAGLAASHECLGSRWLDAYLTAPVWRFQLHPGVAGAQAWLGVCFPSVDRVGRHFPLTVALPLPVSGPAAAPLLLLQDDAALLRLEDLALQALDPRTSVAALEAGLGRAELGFVHGPVASPALPPLPSRRFEPAATPEDVHAACSARAAAAVTFFTWGSEAMPATLLSLPALPPPAAFAGLLSSDAGAGAGCPTEPARP